MAQTEETRILDIQVKYTDAINAIAEFKRKIDELKASERDLGAQLESGAISTDEYRRSMAASGEVQKDYKEQVRTLSKEVQNNIKTQNEQEGSLRSLRAELSNATKAYDSMSKAERESASGKALRDHINEITTQIKDEEEATQRFYRNVGNYKESIMSALGINNSFASSLLSMSKNGKGMNGIIEGVTDEVKSFSKTLLSMMSNPVFIALAGIAGAGMAFKWFYDYNMGILQATRLTKEFLGLTGESLQAMRDEIQATADTYGKDFKETLEGVDVLTAQWGMDAQDSLKVINEGFQSGADLNGDMLQKIKQYGPVFHDAGVSASEMVAILQQTRSGIFSDKGLDVIQMASKKIREMSTTTASSLDAIGISSKQVEKDLQSGSKNTFDVIQMVSDKLKVLPQDSQAVGDALKNVFGKQAASGGLKMIESLGTMSTKIDEVKKKTGAWGDNMDKQRKANEEYNKTLSAMFDMSQKGFGQMVASSKLFITQGLTEMMKGLVNVLNYMIDWYNESTMLRAAIQGEIALIKTLWTVVKTVFNLIIDSAKFVGRSFKGIGDIIEGVVKLDWNKIKSGYSELGSNIYKTLKEGLGDIKNAGVELGRNYVQGFNNAVNGGKIAHISLSSYSADTSTADNVVSQSPSAVAGVTGSNGNKNSSGGKSSSNNKSSADAIKKENEEVQKAEDLLTQLIENSVDRQRQIIEQNYDHQINTVKTKLATEKNLTTTAREAMNSQIVSLEKIKSKKLSEFDMNAKDEEIKRETEYYATLLESIEKGSEQEYQIKLRQIADQHQLDLDELEQSTMSEEDKGKQREAIEAKYNKMIEDEQKEHSEALNKAQEDAIKKRFESKIAQTEDNSNTGEAPEVAKARLAMEESLALLENAHQMEGESIEQFNERKLALQQDYNEKCKKYSQANVTNEISELDAIGKVVNSTGDLLEAFGTKNKTLAAASKVLALAQISISTGVAISKGIAAAQDAGKWPANLIAIATVVSTILSGMASAIKTVNSAKFATGGDVTGSGTATSDSISASLSNGESVLTTAATSMFAPALSAFNQIGGGVPIYGQGNNQDVGTEYLALAVARGMQMAPRPIVSVEEINAVSNRVQTIQRIGTI